MRKAMDKPLHTLSLIKDIFATAGVPTGMGSPAITGHIPNKSAGVIKWFEARGAFVLGKTVTTECAFPPWREKP